MAERLGVRLTGDGMRQLLGLALRRNPKRAHLLVSTVLGKHVPQRPSVVLEAGTRLGARVRELLGAGQAADAVVLGFAETATGLGLTVAYGMGSRAGALHSTRRAVAEVARFGAFEEEHSHATSHLLLPKDPGLLRGDGPLVLVDDELSTGRTVRNTIAALHAAHPRQRYVVAALVDTRGGDDVAELEKFAADLGARIDVVALAAGRVRLPADVLERGSTLVARHGGTPAPAPAAERGTVERVELGWPAGLPDGGRHGFGPREQIRLEAALPAMAARLADALGLPAAGDSTPGEVPRVLVLGTEELMYAPLRLACALEERTGSRAEIRFSTTTRSPVLAVDDPGYAIRTALRFPAHDTPDATRDASVATGPGGGPARRPAPLHGPAFSSYDPEDVAWLLRDLSDVPLEAPTEEREEAIQAGGAHYAESLPVEYQPSPEYQRLFHSALESSAARLARAVGTVTETVLAERGPRPVLVSLARAGTPVGVLMRRWARQTRGLDLPHYAVSIVRGRGIDTNALAHLAAHHDPADIVFVDGWTGKGAITRELAQALAAHPRFVPELAVLADPGSCVSTFGTREDFLIPSACLNSTVSGLISRTVLRADLIGPHDFHGAKFYRELAGNDVSRHFVDTVAAHFTEVRDGAVRDAAALAAADRTPSWAGWRAVEEISEAYGIGDVNLIKPGVGETTRVLLRRVPWRILARRGAGADLDHVRLLAEQRGVPVEETDELPYTCVGLIHPRYTRGATGADGKAAR
ncbi:phosphoribosyltransferase [Streptomyces albus]|nr:phosphoribosyltransferase [Streptomyces albus]